MTRQLKLTDIQSDGDSGYYVTINGRETHLTGGDVELDPSLMCGKCGAKEIIEDDGAAGFAPLKLYSDEHGNVLCSACLGAH